MAQDPNRIVTKASEAAKAAIEAATPDLTDLPDLSKVPPLDIPPLDEVSFVHSFFIQYCERHVFSMFHARERFVLNRSPHNI